jgi:sialate O-acetylesterase
MRLHTIAVFALALVGIPLHGEVKLPRLLSDHAVLQRDRPARIWGWAEPSEQITLKFHSHKVSAVANRF